MEDQEQVYRISKQFLIKVMKKRQYRSNQGRTPKKEAESMKVILAAAAVGAIGSVLYIIADLIW